MRSCVPSAGLRDGPQNLRAMRAPCAHPARTGEPKAVELANLAQRFQEAFESTPSGSKSKKQEARSVANEKKAVQGPWVSFMALFCT